MRPVRTSLLLASVAVLAGCGSDGVGRIDTPRELTGALTPLERPAQRSGDPDAGWDYLLYGDYVGSGIPLDVVQQFFPDFGGNHLGRTGDSEQLPTFFNIFDAPNGARVVGGLNCFGCHGAFFPGVHYGSDTDFQVGLGNTYGGFDGSTSGALLLMERVIKERYGEDSLEWEAAEPLVRGAGLTARAKAPFEGVNPAFRLEEISAAHRNPRDLSFSEEPLFEIDEDVVLASDVPPWWHVKKKPALYYNGMGRGDFARLMMQVSIVGLTDLDQAESIDAQMPGVLSWLETLEPPPFPADIDAEAAARGEQTFEALCVRCHGTYGENETYPGVLVSLDEVGTDPEYALHFAERTGLREWFSQSWYAGGVADGVPLRAYMAPPLDGIWATAPYFHNGSVPDLLSVLDSPSRPAQWRKHPEEFRYDIARVGWALQPVEEAESPREVYDTSVKGFGNGGHVWADALSEAERADLLEYLKTL